MTQIADSAADGEVLSQAVSKVKRHMLSLFFIMFIVNYMDRVNIGFVRPHIESDLRTGAAAYDLGADLFFVGYALLLGVAEAGFFLGVIYYFTRWLPKEERGKAIAIFLSGSATVSLISGLLAGALMQIQGLWMHGWQWMLFIEVMVSFSLCFAVWFWLGSTPTDAKWLTSEKKDALNGAIDRERYKRESMKDPKPRVWSLLSGTQIVLFCVLYFSIQLTIYVATFWLPSIIKSMGGLSDIQVGFLNSIPWLISIIVMYAFAACTGRWELQQASVATALLIAGLGMFMSTIGDPSFAFVAVCFAAIGFKSASSLFWSIPQGYLDVRIAAAVIAIALINSLGSLSLGGFIAPTTLGILEQQTGAIQGGLYGLACTSLLAVVLVFFARTAPKGANERAPITQRR